MADTKTIEPLREALEDEYKARATYRKVIEVFGPVRPFLNIVEAEERHAQALLRQCERLGVRPPEDTWQGRVATPRSLTEACEGAVHAQIDNAAMYERLIVQVSDPVVRRVMQRLEEASQKRHLPAFKRCLSRGGVEGAAPASRDRGRRQEGARRSSRTTSAA